MGNPETMTADAVARIRAELGLSAADLAHQLGRTPAIVEAFERGEVTVPRKEARTLRYLAAAQERETALATSGLPECRWVADWEAQKPTQSLDTEVERLESLSAHSSSCETCIARDQYVLSRFGPMPSVPLPVWVRLLGPIVGRIDRLPRWARPPVTMALVFLAFTLLRGVLMAPRIVENASAAGSFLLAIPATLALGATVGFLITGWRVVRAKFGNRPSSVPSA